MARLVAGAALVVLAGMAVAQTQPPREGTPAPVEPQSPGEQALEGLDLLMRALEGWIRQIPRYAPPEITPEGDIIIRRLDRPPGRGRDGNEPTLPPRP